MINFSVHYASAICNACLFALHCSREIAANVANVWITAQRSTIVRIMCTCMAPMFLSRNAYLGNERCDLWILINRRLTTPPLTINDTLPACTCVSHLCDASQTFIKSVTDCRCPLMKLGQLLFLVNPEDIRDLGRSKKSENFFSIISKLLFSYEKVVLLSKSGLFVWS